MLNTGGEFYPKRANDATRGHEYKSGNRINEIRTRNLEPMTNNLVMNVLIRVKAAVVANSPELASAILHCQFVHVNVFHSLKPPLVYASIRS